MKVVCFDFPVPTFAEQRGNKSKNGPKHLILSSTVTPDLPMSQQSCFNKLTGEVGWGGVGWGGVGWGGVGWGGVGWGGVGWGGVGWGGVGWGGVGWGVSRYI